MIRLDKYLADMGIGTRREVKRYIRQGRITLNDKVTKSPDTKVKEETDEVRFDNKQVSYVSHEYYMLNKPSNVISASEDRDEQTVVDLIREKRRRNLFPVGRLDKDTEGLLLITDDGELAHRLLSPKKHVDKTYFARVRGRVTEEDLRRFAEGVNIGTEEADEWTMPAVLKILKSDEESEIRLTIREGKYHQVKRMFQAVGKEVLYLKRESMGGLKLDEHLKPGEYRPLTKEELDGITDNNAGKY